MDGNFFKKYEQRIQKNKTEKGELLQFIKEKTGVVLQEGEISINNKKIKIQTSSTKKAFLQKGGISNLLKEKGYSFFF